MPGSGRRPPHHKPTYAMQQNGVLTRSPHRQPASLDHPVRERGQAKIPSLELISHFVDPGLDARFVLFTARRARSAGCADDLVADLDRQRALVGYDVGEMDQAERRIRL